MSVNLIIVVVVVVHSDIVAGTMDSGATTAVPGESIRIYSTSGVVTSQSLWSRYTIAILYKSLFTEEIGSTQRHNSESINANKAKTTKTATKFFCGITRRNALG